MASSGKRQTRFHGRVDAHTHCSQPGCTEPGEFRAPPADGRRSGFDGPGDWRWLCLDHVRQFNNGYNYFNGMSADEIEAAQTPYGGWERETRAFSANGSPPPRWADFTDPLDAIGARFRRSPGERRKRAPIASSGSVKSDQRGGGEPLVEKARVSRSHPP